LENGNKNIDESLRETKLKNEEMLKNKNENKT
jgi:hypothetical protein